jgi:hypothetical protein
MIAEEFAWARALGDGSASHAVRHTASDKRPGGHASRCHPCLTSPPLSSHHDVRHGAWPAGTVPSSLTPLDLLIDPLDKPIAATTSTRRPRIRGLLGTYYAHAHRLLSLPEPLYLRSPPLPSSPLEGLIAESAFNRIPTITPRTRSQSPVRGFPVICYDAGAYLVLRGCGHDPRVRQRSR